MFLNNFTQLKKEEYINLVNKQLEKKKKIKEHNEFVRKLINYNKMNVSFQLKEHYDSVIPLNVYTCWHTAKLPPLMKANYDLLVEQNPEFNFHLYDENACREFIKGHFEEYVSNAYDNLIPCSYKSDLWRFCVLYINGGVYMDIKYKCVNNFKLIALTEKEYFVKDRPKGMAYTALIVVKPNNNIMLQCIKRIVENVKTKYYGTSCLSPTGPGLLGSFFTLTEIEDMEICFKDAALENKKLEEFMVYKDIIILKYYDQYRIEQQKYQKNKRYGELWNEHNIYK